MYTSSVTAVSRTVESQLVNEYFLSRGSGIDPHQGMVGIYVELLPAVVVMVFNMT